MHHNGEKDGLQALEEITDAYFAVYREKTKKLRLPVAQLLS